MKLESLKEIAIGLGFVAVQIVLFRHLKFYGTQPDIVLVYVLWIMARRDRTTAILFAFGLGFVQDALLDTWGLNMFAKTAIAFFAFSFIPKLSEIRLLVWQVFLTILGVSLVHNLLYLALSSITGAYATDLFFWRLWLGNSLYTAVVGSFIYLFNND